MANTKIQSEQIADDVALAGSPTTTTQSASDNSTKVATTAYVTTAVANLVDSAPSSLDTLNELAAAMNDNASFFSTVLPLSGGTMTGNISHASDFTLDVGGDIILDADGGDVYFKDDGTTFLQFKHHTSTDIYSLVSDNDLKLIVRDGSSNVEALVFDAANGGAATFAHDVSVIDNRGFRLGSDNDSVIYNDGSNLYVKNNTSNQDIIFQGNDDGSTGFQMLKLDASNAGAAIFGGSILAPATGVIETQSSAGTLTISGGATNKGGQIVLSGGNNTGSDGSGIKFYAQASTATPSERMRLDSSGNLALMTDGAEFKLYYTEPRKFISNSGASATIKQIDNNATNAYIDFAAWDNSSLMRLMNSGNLLVGKTNTTFSNDGIELRGGNGGARFIRSNAEPILMNRTGSDGKILGIYKAGAEVGSLGVLNSDNLTISGAVADHSGLQFALHEIVPLEANADCNGTISLGSANSKFADLYLSGGAYLGGTGTANKLDDYEEGNWTPQLEDASGNDCTHAGESGQYTKIGNLVYVQFAIGISSKSGVGNGLQISGLPFAVENVSHGSGEPSGGLITYLTGLTTGNYGLILARANNASSFIELKYTGSSYSTYGGNALNATDIGASTYIAGSCIYRT